MSARKKSTGTRTISAADWVAASRKRLVQKGISEVKVEPLAKYLGVTPGSFYWHFKNRQSLYRALLCDWLKSNVAPFNQTFDLAEENPREQYLAMAYVWVLCPDFDPALETAIREWSKTSKLVARLIRHVDANRIGLYQGIFEDFGHSTTSAFVRARTMYFHQIGYYSMKVEEDFDARLLLLPYYAEIMTGDPWFLDCKTAEGVRKALEGFRRRESPSAKMARRRQARG